jgi:transitional endoplasmic reticulum ATPase
VTINRHGGIFFSAIQKMIFPRIELCETNDFDTGDWIQVVTSELVYYGRIWPSKIPKIQPAIFRKLKVSEESIQLDQTIDIPCKLRKWQIKLPNCLSVTVEFASTKDSELLKTELLLILDGYVVRGGCTVVYPDCKSKIHILETIADQSKSPDCIITKNTMINIHQPPIQKITKPAQHAIKLNSIESSFHDIIDTLIFWRKSINKLGIDVPKGIILYGEPGVGKTSLVFSLSKQYNIQLFKISSIDIHSGDGEKKLCDLFKQASDISLKEDKPCIILIDELDSVGPNRETDPSSSSIVAQLLTLMDGFKKRDQLIIIGTTNRINAIDPALRRPGRFDREIRIGVPDLLQRIELLTKLTQYSKLDQNVNFEILSENMNGYVLADIVSLIREATVTSIYKNKDLITMDDFVQGLKLGKPAILRDSINIEKITWDDLGGIDEIKSKLIRSVEWPISKQKEFERFGLSFPKGILLYGPPGCSKTTIAKVLGNSCGYSFFSLNGASLYSSLVGESEHIIRSLFIRARNASPAIIFLDEVEALVGKREFSGKSSGDTVQERILSTMLNEMDGIESAKNVIVIGATNRPDMIDQALLRPGRFDPVIYVLLN